MTLQRAGAFDPAQLDIAIAERGFVIGVSKVGEAIGTGSGERADITGEVHAVQIDRKRGVDDDLFVSSTPPGCTVTLVYPDSVPKLKNKDLVVSYRGQQLYRGNVNASTRSASVDRTAPGNKKWAVTMQSRDYNYGSRKLNLSQFTSEQTMVGGLLERVPGIAEVNVSASVLDRARTFRMAPGTDWGTELTDQSTFLNDVGRTLSCIVDIDPASPRVLNLVGYGDGITWTVDDSADAEISYTAVQIDEDTSYPTGILVNPVGANAVEGDAGVSASYYSAGLMRNDKSLTVATPVDQKATRAVLNTYPTFSSLPESVRSVTIPFDERLDLSGTPTRIAVWIDGRKWEGAITGYRHSITAASSPRDCRWMITVDISGLYLVTREGLRVPPVPSYTTDATGISWTPVTEAVTYRLGWRNDGRWAQYPDDVQAFVALPSTTSSYAWPMLSGQTYCVSLWAYVSASVFSEPRTMTIVR